MDRRPGDEMSYQNSKIKITQQQKGGFLWIGKKEEEEYFVM